MYPVAMKAIKAKMSCMIMSHLGECGLHQHCWQQKHWAFSACYDGPACFVYNGDQRKRGKSEADHLAVLPIQDACTKHAQGRLNC